MEGRVEPKRRDASGVTGVPTQLTEEQKRAFSSGTSTTTTTTTTSTTTAADSTTTNAAAGGQVVPLSFQEMYGTEEIDSRFIHNVSRLHLATQLTMLKKANLLVEKSMENVSAVDRNSTIAGRLALAEKSDESTAAKDVEAGLTEASDKGRSLV